jgi:hypothetical protein
VKPEAAEATTMAAVDSVKELKRFMAEFGAEQGAKWFAEGVCHADAEKLHIQNQFTAKDSLIAKLKTDNEQLTKKLAEAQEFLTLARGEDKPLSFSVAPSVEPTGEQKKRAEFVKKNEGTVGKAAAAMGSILQVK